MNLISHLSPNYWLPSYVLKVWNHRRKVRFIVIHTTEGTYPGDIDWLCNPLSQVSAHFYIKRTGEIYVLVHTGDIAWHCAVAADERTDRPDIWQVWGEQNGNWDSVGIECEAAVGVGVTEDQMVSLVALSAYLVKLYKIPVDRLHIVGHYELKTTKRDPPHFNWGDYMARLRETLSPETH